MRTRYFTLFCALALLTELSGAGRAAAADYCVGESATSALCPPGSQDYTFDQAGTQAALNQAASFALSPGHDRVLFADGTINISTMVSTTPIAGETVELVGESDGDTRLVVGSAAAQALWLNFGSVPTSEIRSLAFDVPGRAGSAARGLLMVGAGKISDCEFVVTGDGGNTDYGIEGSATLEISNSTFTMTGAYAYGMYVTGQLTVTGSNFTGNTAGNNTAIQASGNGIRVVRGSTFRNHYRAISFDQGDFDVYDTLIDIGSQANAYGFFAGNANNGVGTITLDLDAVTVIGSLSNQVGVHVEAGTTNPAGETANVTVKNAIFRLPVNELRCREENNGVDVFGTSTLAIDHTLIDPAKNLLTGSGSCDRTQSAMLDGSTVTPLFADSGAGDYRPAIGSPVIEAGDPTTDTTGRATDAGGVNRFADFDGDGSATIDLGAYEYQPSAPTTPVITASTTTPTTGDTVGFTAASIDSDGDSLSYAWTFGDGGVATGAAASHAFGTVGSVTVTVTVSDGTGRSSQSNVTIRVAAPTLAPPAAAIRLGRATGKFKRSNKPFSIVSSTRKPHISVNASVETEVTISLARKSAGYRSGSRCVKRKPSSGRAKRCNLKLRGSLILNLPAGDSALVFGGKWMGKKLANGRYEVTMTARGINDGKRAVLSLIR